MNIKDILSKISDKGFKCFIVGGYTRDFLLCKNNNDIDIITNARRKDLLKIFPNSKIVKGYEGIKIDEYPYNIDITTFRMEYDLRNGKPNKIIYIDDLERDLLRRDFTINALCLDKDFNLIDPYNYKKDLDNKIIKVIGDTKVRFDEDESRILRAIRLSITHDFKLDKDIVSYINKYPFKLSNISYFKRKIELDKIFSSNNIKNTLKMLKNNKLEDYLDIKINSIKYSPYLLGMWAQIEFSDKYPFTKKEKTIINKVKKIISNKKLDKYTIYKNGLEISLICASILDIDNIENIYNSLPIKNRDDLALSSIKISNIIKVSPSKKLGNIIKRIEKEIIYGKIKNSEQDIIKYLEGNALK